MIHNYNYNFISNKDFEKCIEPDSITKKYKNISNTYFKKLMESDNTISCKDLSYSKFINVSFYGNIINCKMCYCEIKYDIDNNTMDNGGLFFNTNLSYSKFTNMTIRDITFKKSRLSNVKFEKCNIFDCKFKDCSFVGVIIKDCHFVNCEFSNIDFTDSTIINTEFSNCNIMSNFSKAKIYNSYFESKINHSILYNTIIESSHFYKIDNSDLTNSKIIKTNYEHITNSNLSDSIFENCNFTNVDCSNSIFNNTYFINCNMYNMNIKNSNFTYKNLDNNSIESINKYCPDKEFIAWKLAYYINRKTNIKSMCILKVLVPEDAKRKWTTGNIITVSKVKLLEVIDYNDNKLDYDNIDIFGIYNNYFKYKLNETSISKSYDDEFTDHGYGIHVVYNYKDPSYFNKEIIENLFTK